MIAQITKVVTDKAEVERIMNDWRRHVTFMVGYIYPQQPLKGTGHKLVGVFHCSKATAQLANQPQAN